ncbi:hypothetical protein [Streptomyces sp. NPDC046332]|uniref:hypothetical protein n=1 Tax=unclassified Streptomyces TaxID=2593676 RepID=UPI0033CCC979
MVDEPTFGEILRDVQADVRRLVQDQAMYVTQEQRASDKEIAQLRHDALAKDQAEDRDRLDRLTRNFWTTLVAPILVGVVLYFLLGGKP